MHHSTTHPAARQASLSPAAGGAISMISGFGSSSACVIARSASGYGVVVRVLDHVAP
jgi:hypothetical protein